jgi:hypothetical protein
VTEPTETGHGLILSEFSQQNLERLNVGLTATVRCERIFDGPEQRSKRRRELSIISFFAISTSRGFWSSLAAASWVGSNDGPGRELVL